MRDRVDRGIIRAIVATPWPAFVNSLLVLIRPFFNLCLLRSGPQDLPASSVLLAIALSAYTISSILGAAVQLEIHAAVLAGLLDTALLVGLTTSVLYLHRLAARVMQTLTALSGSGALLVVVALPLAWMSGPGGAESKPTLSGLALVGIQIWYLLVFGHILRHALSAPLFVGLMVAGVFIAVFYLTVEQLFLPHP